MAEKLFNRSPGPTPSPKGKQKELDIDQMRIDVLEQWYAVSVPFLEKLKKIEGIRELYHEQQSGPPAIVPAPAVKPNGHFQKAGQRIRSDEEEIDMDDETSEEELPPRRPYNRAGMYRGKHKLRFRTPDEQITEISDASTERILASGSAGIDPVTLTTALAANTAVFRGFPRNVNRRTVVERVLRPLCRQGLIEFRVVSSADRTRGMLSRYFPGQMAMERDEPDKEEETPVQAAIHEAAQAVADQHTKEKSHEKTAVPIPRSDGKKHTGLYDLLRSLITEVFLEHEAGRKLAVAQVTKSVQAKTGWPDKLPSGEFISNLTGRQLREMWTRHKTLNRTITKVKPSPESHPIKGGGYPLYWLVRPKVSVSKIGG